MKNIEIHELRDGYSVNVNACEYLICISTSDIFLVQQLTRVGMGIMDKGSESFFMEALIHGFEIYSNVLIQHLGSLPYSW